MKLNLRRIAGIIVFTIVLTIIQSCMTIETDMNIESNLTGTSVSTLSVTKGILPEEELKKEVERLGIKEYELKKEESTDSTVDKYSLKMKWSTDEELSKILLFINTGAEMAQMGKNFNPTLSNKNTESTESSQAEKNENTVKIETKEENIDKNGKKDEKSSKENQGKIFIKNDNTITVDMGTIKIKKMVVKVKGKIIENSTQAGIVSASKNEITFYEGDKANFKYKNDNTIFLILIGVAIGVLAIGGILAFIMIKRKKSADVQTMEDIEEMEEMEGFENEVSSFGNDNEIEKKDEEIQDRINNENIGNNENVENNQTIENNESNENPLNHEDIDNSENHENNQSEENTKNDEGKDIN